MAAPRKSEADAGWVVCKVRLRVAEWHRVQALAEEETRLQGRKVHGVDLIRDALRGYLKNRPDNKTKPESKAPRFQPSSLSVPLRKPEG